MVTILCIAATAAAVAGPPQPKADNVLTVTHRPQCGLRAVQAQTRPAQAILTAVADGDLAAVVHAILAVAGRTEESVRIVASAKVPTAAAIESGGRRSIQYNPVFLAELSREAETDWAVVFILAHEIAHHLTGHTTGARSDPNGTTIELEANEIAGFVLGRLGASHDAAVRVLTAASYLVPTAVLDLEASVAAVQRGWRKGVQVAAR